MPLERRWLTAFVDECQRLAGHALDPHPTDATLGLRALVAEAPASISLPERFLVRGLFAELAARLEREAPARSRALSRALLAVSPITPADTFRDELARLVDSCEETLPKASAPAKRPTPR
jgi:hypothetical protein